MALPQRYIGPAPGAVATFVRATLGGCDGMYEHVRRKSLPDNDPQCRREAVEGLCEPCAVSRLHGLRTGEAKYVTWADIDFVRCQLHVRGDPKTATKNGEMRYVPMIPELEQMLGEAAVRAIE